MKLKFTGSVKNEHAMSVEADTESSLSLRHREPRLTMTKEELERACPSVSRASVLTVVVTDEKGRESRVHFSVGLTPQGRVVGEVLAVTANSDVTKKAVAAWYKPRTREDELKDRTGVDDWKNRRPQ